MLAPDILQKIKTMQLRASFLASEILAGAYESAFKGQGMEFAEVREYCVGDDVRSINWRVTARMQAPFVKVMREERESTLLLMVDVSASMRLGTAGRSKQDLAAELAAILAYLAIRNHDKVGLLVFSDRVEAFIPPRQGRSHIWQIIRAVLAHGVGTHATDIGVAANFAQQLLKRRSTVFLLSDFLSDGWQDALRMLRARHDIVAVTVSDPREHLALPQMGIAELVDSETGRRIFLDTSSAADASRLLKSCDNRRRRAQAELRQLRVDGFAVSTAGHSVNDLQRYLSRRDRLRSRR